MARAFTSNHKNGNMLTLALVVSMVLSSLAERHLIRGAGHQARHLHLNHRHQVRDLQLGDSLFDLELVASESKNDLIIPGEDERYYQPSDYYSGKGKTSKSTKSSKGKSCKCGSGKSKGSKSKKGGSSYEYCPCDGAYPPGYHPTPSPGNGDGTGDGGEGGGDSGGDGEGTDNGDGVEGDHNNNGIPDIYEGEGDGSDGDSGGDGSGGDDSGTSSGGAVNCDAIREGTGPTWGQQENLNGELQAVYYTEDVEKEKVLAFIYNVMNNTVRIWMAGCELASRRLEENATIYNVVMEQTMESMYRGACDTSIEGAECIMTDTPTDVYVGSGSTHYLAGNLNDAINRAVQEGKFNGLSGLYAVSGPNGDTYGTTDGDRETNSASAAQDDGGLGVAGKVIIPVAAVTLFLLAILFLRRRHNETTHVKGAAEDSLLDYETDEETSANRARFVNDDDTLSSGPFDDTDEYDYNDSALGQNQDTMDVHICQSSLCEACEQRDRHNGISFVKTGAPSSPERLPANSTREYSTSDTVSL